MMKGEKKMKYEIGDKVSFNGWLPEEDGRNGSVVAVTSESLTVRFEDGLEHHYTTMQAQDLFDRREERG